MSGRPFYATAVARVESSASARVIAEQMFLHAVGCVVVVDADRRPLGVVTDRDLCLRVVARGLDAGAVTAGGIASGPAHVARADEPLEVVAARMSEAGVRRVPVVDDDGRLIGIVAIDDLVVSLGRELEWLGSAAKLEIRESLREARPARRLIELEERIASLEASALAAGRDAMAFVDREFEALRERLRRLASRDEDGSGGKSG